MLEPGSLWIKVRAGTEQALLSGALHSLPTHYEFIEQDGIPFLIRVLSNLVHKDEARRQQGQASHKPRNPFLPYDEKLFVADISDTHVCLLNKFNVLDHHLLIVTRTFEEQEGPLTRADFEALASCMAEFDGLAFYNAGDRAGASQSHKHLQLIPLPLAPEGPAVPLESVFSTARFQNDLGRVPALPFQHVYTRLDPAWFQSPTLAAEALLECYGEMLQAVGLEGPRSVAVRTPSGPYNLLATRQWAMLVPRSREHFAGISINALGFAGALLVRDERQKQLLTVQGPLTALRQVAAAIDQ